MTSGLFENKTIEIPLQIINNNQDHNIFNCICRLFLYNKET